MDDRGTPPRATERTGALPGEAPRGGRTPGERVPDDRVPGERPPPEARRLLARPPGERYVRAPTDAEDGDESESRRAGSVLRLFVAAILTAVISGALLIVLASPLAISEPLVIVAGLGGIATGLAARWGAGSVVSRHRSRRIAAAIAAVTVVIVQVAVWQLAIAQGGVLPLVDYLAETFGLVVPLELAAAVVGAWATA